MCACPRFPGSPKAYDVLLEVIDVELLAEGIEWISLHPTAGNTSYNLSNGDIFRWSEVTLSQLMILLNNLYLCSNGYVYLCMQSLFAARRE